jgi:hypothetical protein
LGWNPRAIANDQHEITELTEKGLSFVIAKLTRAGGIGAPQIQETTDAQHEITEITENKASAADSERPRAWLFED